MSRKQESFRDLVESRSAAHGIAPRTLWRLALDAIARNALVPILPEGVSLDTKSDHGGMSWTWRGVVVDALRRIERANPSDFPWSSKLKFDPAVFDQWLNAVLQAFEERSRLPRRKRPSAAEVRRVVQNYVDEVRKAGGSTSIPRMWGYVKRELPEATRDQATKALRAIEGGPKPRGRPRRPRPTRK